MSTLRRFSFSQIALALFCVGSTTQAELSVGDSWRVLSPSPTAENLSSVALLPTKILAAGNGTTVLTSAVSSHGETWSGKRVDSKSSIHVPSYIAYSSTASKALLASGVKFWQSTDEGGSWSEVTTDLPAFFRVRNLQAAQGEFMALLEVSGISGSTTILATSTDGQSWTVRGTLPPASNTYPTFASVTRDTAGRYVVVGSVYVEASLGYKAASWSILGSNPWTTAMLENGNLSDVLWTGSAFVAVGGDKSYYSTGGSIWTQGGSPGNNVKCLAHDGSKLVAASLFGAAYSTDNGVTWTNTGPVANFPDELEPSDMLYDGTAWVAVGGRGKIFTSPNGENWTRRAPMNRTADFAAIAHNGQGGGGSLYMAIGVDGYAWKSPDASNWTRVSSPMLFGGESVVWDGSKFVFVSELSSHSTPDGDVWSTSDQFGQSGAIDTMTKVLFSAGKYVAIGSDNNTSNPVIYSGSAANAFTKRRVPAGSGSLKALTKSGALWVIVGTGGTILTSVNGDTWVKRNAGAAAMSFDFDSVASNGSLIIASSSIGYGDYFTSTNGTAWVRRTNNIGSSFAALAWTGTSYIGIVSDARVLKSTNGISWAAIALPTSQAINSLNWTGTELLGTGSNGTVIGSDLIPEINFTTSAQSVFESTANATVVVSLTAPASSALALPISVLPSSTALAADYGTLPTVVNFTIGQQAQVVTLPLSNDSMIDGNKTLRIEIGAVTGTRQGSLVNHTVTLLDDDATPAVSFNRTVQTSPEHAGSVSVELELSWPAPGPVTVSLTPTGTATKPADYIAPATVSFSAGQQRKLISISVTDDSDVESLETAVFTLSSPNGATLDTSSMVFTLSLQDNDPNTAPGSRWTLRQPLPMGDSIQAVTGITGSGFTGFMAVGDGGTVLTSTDAGATWTRRNTGLPEVDLKDVCVTADGSLILAAGTDGHILTSADGISWADCTVPEAAKGMVFYSISVGNGRIVAVGEFQNPESRAYVPLIYSSEDGNSWVAETLPISSGSLFGVTWNAGFVAVGHTWLSNTTRLTHIMHSADGRIWRDGSSALSNVALTSIVPLAGTSYAAFDHSNSLYTLTNAGVWTKHSAGKLGRVGRGVVGQSKFIAVGTAITTATNATDGFPLTQAAAPTSTFLHDIAFFQNQFVAIGGTSAIFTSANGSIWTQRSAGFNTESALLGATWAGTQFIAVGENRNGYSPTAIATSPDGIVWTERPNTLNKSLRSVAWSGATAIAVGAAGAIAGSTNGNTWALRTSGTTLDLSSVIWAQNQFIAVGGNLTRGFSAADMGGSIVLTSPDGTRWTRRAVPTNHPLLSITFANNRYYAVGGFDADGSTTNRAVILTSADAVIWQSVSSGPLGADLTGVAVNPVGKIAATTSDARIWFSTNGINWAAASSVPTQTPGTRLRGVIWAGSRFIAIGDHGLSLYSTDGETWTTSVTEISSGSVSGLAWNSQTLVAVGDNASVQTSGTGLSLTTPTLAFDLTSSSVSEAGGLMNLIVSLSSPATSRVSVSLGNPVAGVGMSLTGATADLNLPTTALVLNPGETSKAFVIPLRQDNVVEDSEMLSLTLTTLTGPATLGTQTMHTLTLLDDDTAITVVAPASRLVTTGSQLLLNVTPSGSAPFTYQWNKDGKALPASVIGSRTSGLLIPSLTVTDGGSYTCTVTNRVGSLTTTATKVGIYTVTPLSDRTGSATATIAVSQAASSNCSLRWFKGNTEITAALPSGVTLNSNRSTLMVKDLTTNSGAYSCTVELPGVNNAPFPTGSEFNIGITGAAPSLNALASLPAATIGSYYYQIISANGGAVASWTVTGLPKGLSFSSNNTTGVISGFAEVASATARVVTITATNSISSSTIRPTIIVNPLPSGLAGNHTGLIPRHEGNRQLGGHISFTATSAGLLTGAVTLGSVRTTITGRLLQIPTTNNYRLSDMSSGSTVRLVSAGQIFSLTFSYDAEASGNTGTGALDLLDPVMGISSVSFGTRAALTGISLTNYQARYNFALQLASPDIDSTSIPQGHGFGNAAVSASGIVLYAGKMSDGSAILASSQINIGGFSPLYSSLYRGQGSLMSLPVLTLSSGSAFLDNTILDTTSTTWIKFPDPSVGAARNFPAGWSAINLKLEGSRYLAPAPNAVVMGMNYQFFPANTEFDFKLPTSERIFYGESFEVNIRPTGKIDPLFDNPWKATLSVKPADGTFSGTVDMSNRLANYVFITRKNVKYEGQIVRIIGADKEQRAYGFMTLPLMPDIRISPMPAATTTPILSLPVTLTPRQFPF